MFVIGDNQDNQGYGLWIQSECGPEVDVDSNSTSQYKTCHWKIK